MLTDDTTGSTPSRRRPEKRHAIVEAAAAVFGREGYTRASVDAIAAEAGVSKRTVYNHFGDKEQLFLSAALETSGDLTTTVTAITDRHLHKITDLRADLTAYAVERATAILSAGDHGALGRAIRAEAANIPRDVLAAWLDAGPVASLTYIAGHFERLASQGLLTIEDPALAAEHFTLLTFTGAADRSFFGALPISDEEIRTIAATGVDAFLRAYGPAGS